MLTVVGHDRSRVGAGSALRSQPPRLPSVAATWGAVTASTARPQARGSRPSAGRLGPGRDRCPPRPDPRPPWHRHRSSV